MITFFSPVLLQAPIHDVKQLQQYQNLKKNSKPLKQNISIEKIDENRKRWTDEIFLNTLWTQNEV